MLIFVVSEILTLTLASPVCPQNIGNYCGMDWSWYQPGLISQINVGSNPSPATCHSSSVGRVSDLYSDRQGFDSSLWIFSFFL